MKKNLELNDTLNAYFLEIGKWSRFLGIVGYVGVGLLVLISFTTPYFIKLSGASELAKIPSTTLSTVYFILAGVYFYPVNYLYKFGTQIKISLNNNDETTFLSAVKNLKSHYKFIGVFTLVLVSLYGFIFMMSLLSFFL
jgi:hypothetical protein